MQDGTQVNEVLTKNKRWFNGTHCFRTVKVTPTYPQEVTDLAINVGDTVKTGEKIG